MRDIVIPYGMENKLFYFYFLFYMGLYPYIPGIVAIIH